MPECRDRLPRHGDVISAWSRGRIGSIPFVLEDGDDDLQAITPFRWREMPMVSSPGSIGLAARRKAAESPRIKRFSPIRGPENISPVAGRGRESGSRSALPSWYPRRPLNDITAVMRAIEGRRGGNGLESKSRIQQDISLISPRPTLLSKCCPPTTSKFSKMLLDITHKTNEDSSYLTPEKKLLIVIDAVEKVVMKELRKMERTPTAKKAEREKRLRTLMSMR